MAELVCAIEDHLDELHQSLGPLRRDKEVPVPHPPRYRSAVMVCLTVAVATIALACTSASNSDQSASAAVAQQLPPADQTAAGHAGHAGDAAKNAKGGEGGHGRDHGGWDQLNTSSDLLLSTRPGETGVEVFAATAEHGWAPQHVVTIDPGGTEEQEWLANECVSGSGKYAVVVIGPAGTSNPAVLAAGAAAYSVELQTGKVWPIVGGLSMYYDNPGCGADDTAALLGYTDDDQAATRVYRVNLAKEQVDVVFDGEGQINSPVPVKGGVVATSGTDVVRLDGRTATSLAATDGTPFSLRARGDGGVDLLVHHQGRPAMDIVRVGTGGARTVGSGTSGRTKLFGGRNGRTIVAAADRVDKGAGLVAVTGGDSVAVDASLDGGVVEASVAGPANDKLLGRVRRGRDGAPVADITAPEPHAGEAVTEVPSADPEVAKRHGRSAGAAAQNTTTPKCAVPRNDTSRLVRQPTPEQVYWAITQASAGNLKASSGFARPANYYGNGLAAYSPSDDFPIPALGGNSGKKIPPQLAAGVFAQESAMRQAARFALPGVSANPLISNYFGDNMSNPLTRIDYSLADCGYGVAQLTTWMATTTSHQSPWNNDKQVKVALDYAENVAAGLWALAGKWNDTYNVNLRVNAANSDDPTSWYFALWAYNTGLWASNQTKYTVVNGPAPDGALPHGLGWTNNPRNSVYPPDRAPFLRTTWLDSKTPNRWPYQERVLGFVENPLFKYTTWPCIGADYGGCLRYDPPSADTFCVMTSNQCSPTHLPGDPLGYCTRSDRLCWWYAPVNGTWDPILLKGSLFTSNINGPIVVQPPAPVSLSSEPPWKNPYPPNCVRDTVGSEGDPPASAIIVDNLPDKKTIQPGCDNSSWTNQGSFSIVYGKSGTVEIGKIDYHQLGTGWGGHLFFTHNRASSTDTARINVGTWTPPTLTGNFDILVHVADNGASTENARYQVYPSGSTTTPSIVAVNQHGAKGSVDRHRMRWVKLGTFSLSPGAKVVLDNVTGEPNSSGDVAYDAVAFVPTSAGCSGASGTDTDGDRLPDASELAIGSNPNLADTDGDGLPDAWEADPGVPGAGIYLPGRPCRVATRDEVFGPYFAKAGVTDKGEVVGSDARYNFPPDIRHKDTFVEVDWQSCNQDNSGCPSIGIGIGSATLGHKFIDPAYHLPMRAAVQDVVTAFKNTPQVTNPDGTTGVNLHVLVDEKLEHRPSCDQAPSALRGSFFGTPSQRRNLDLVTAKSLAFRYMWSGHSTAFDAASSCPTPTGSDLIFHNPLPTYDWTPYGNTTLRGRDILMSTALAWVCPTDLRFFDLGAQVTTGVYNQNACQRSTGSVNGTPGALTDGLYPNAVFKRPSDTDLTWSYPVSRLLGLTEADGIRQVTGRSMMRLLGVSMGVAPVSARNDPQELSSTIGVRLPVQDFSSWANVSFAPAANDGTAVPVGTFAAPRANLQDSDRDGDGVIEKADNCPGVANADQTKDDDRDGQGNACDPDGDGDGLWDQLARYGWGNSGATNIDTGPGDSDGDGTPNSADADDDGDGRLDNVDNCPAISNNNQTNTDGDSMGDACDTDDDGDGFPDGIEQLSGSSPTNASRKPEFIGQGSSCSDGSDNDGDGKVDAADTGCADSDGDTMPDVADNCVDVANYGWRDSNADGVGDTCEGVKIRGPVGPMPSIFPGANPWAASSMNVRWTTVQAGTYSVRLDSTTCTNGTQVAAGSIDPAVDEDDSDGALLTVLTEIGITALADGPHSVQVCVTAGMTTRNDRVTFNLDRNGPTTLTAPDLDATTDSGASSTDNVTKTQRLRFNVTVPANQDTQRVLLFEDGRFIGSNDLWFSGGFGSLPTVVAIYTSANPSVGAHIYTAVAVDSAGNRSAVSPGITVTVTAT